MLKIYKAGKLIKIDVESKENKISKLRIYGDFFLHPEDSIEIIENVLIGCRYDRCAIKKTIDTVMKKNNIQSVGIDSDSLSEAITL
jgi:Zn ribbon nucleic-acid-binding protein